MSAMQGSLSISLRCLLVAAVLACPRLDAQLVDAGDPAPDFAGTWFNHPDTTLSDLLGRVIYVEFWGSQMDEDWERDRVSYLSRLSREHKEAGLMVIAVTTADKEEIERNLRAWWVDFPVVLLEEEDGDKLESRYGGRAAIIDHAGILRWRGSVWGINEDRLEDMLAEASVIAQLPEEFEKINGFLRFATLDLGKAHKELARAIGRNKDNADLALGMTRLEKVFGADMARVDKMIEELDFGGANALLEELAEGWSGSEPGKEAKAKSSELKRDPEAKRDIKAYDIFLEADYFRRIRKYEDARELYEKVIASYDGTKSAERSRRFLSQIHNK